MNWDLIVVVAVIALMILFGNRFESSDCYAVKKRL